MGIGFTVILGVGNPGKREVVVFRAACAVPHSLFRICRGACRNLRGSAGGSALHQQDCLCVCNMVLCWERSLYAAALSSTADEVPGVGGEVERVDSDWVLCIHIARRPVPGDRKLVVRPGLSCRYGEELVREFPVGRGDLNRLPVFLRDGDRGGFLCIRDGDAAVCKGQAPPLKESHVGGAVREGDRQIRGVVGDTVAVGV